MQHRGHDVGVMDLAAPGAGIRDEFEKERRYFTIVFGDPETSFKVLNQSSEKRRRGRRNQETRPRGRR